MKMIFAINAAHKQYLPTHLPTYLSIYLPTLVDEVLLSFGREIHFLGVCADECVEERVEPTLDVICEMSIVRKKTMDRWMNGWMS